MDFMGDGFRIIVVDDDPDVLRVTCRMLERILPGLWPCRTAPVPIVSTTDAGVGLDLIGKTENGILVTDIDLVNRLNGFDLAEAADHLPVVMVTGATDKHRRRLEELQQVRTADGSPGLCYLSKPFTLNELTTTLKALT